MTHVATAPAPAPAPAPDGATTARIHANLAGKDLLPGAHWVDANHVDGRPRRSVVVSFAPGNRAGRVESWVSAPS